MKIRTFHMFSHRAASCNGSLWLNYCFLSLGVGSIIKAIAIFGKIYIFKSWWIVFPNLAIWGLVIGSIAWATRSCGYMVQFLPGFILLLGIEPLNHYYLHLWKFYNDSLLGIISPLERAVVVGVIYGLVIIIINAWMRKLYELKSK